MGMFSKLQAFLAFPTAFIFVCVGMALAFSGLVCAAANGVDRDWRAAGASILVAWFGSLTVMCGIYIFWQALS
jgi:hypothetical protein